MTGKHYRDNFLFARAKIADTPGVSQHVAYAVNPAPVDIEKGFYFPATGVIAFHPMHTSGKRLHQQPVYEGRATEQFIEAVLADAYRSDDNPLVKVSYCVMEEYGAHRAQQLDEIRKHSVQIEFIEQAEVADFIFIEFLSNTPEGKHRAKYDLVFSNDIIIPLEISTADDPAFLEEVSFQDYSITVGGVVFSLDATIVRMLRLFSWGHFDRDVFGKDQPGS
ncbi:hypothetical protein CWC48_29910 [Pseudomonas sp. S10E 269]|uniref:hypothetical protein n=1 Tax=unclassified Pseudomonas TaxID=196821 RepID=UPI000C25F47A|nr:MULTISPECIES: hypothetical protein [unclassified Pseudomonas]PJK31772.1 hypothetical protein CWC49_29945 [Pseudomonas sp. S09F 262]PJK37546.1 hypothetical protein CWC48_29910 [Pseudomonas sp. S10E 269]